MLNGGGINSTGLNAAATTFRVVWVTAAISASATLGGDVTKITGATLSLDAAATISVPAPDRQRNSSIAWSGSAAVYIPAAGQNLATASWVGGSSGFDAVTLPIIQATAAWSAGGFPFTIPVAPEEAAPGEWIARATLLLPAVKTQFLASEWNGDGVPTLPQPKADRPAEVSWAVDGSPLHLGFTHTSAAGLVTHFGGMYWKASLPVTIDETGIYSGPDGVVFSVTGTTEMAATRHQFASAAWETSAAIGIDGQYIEAASASWSGGAVLSTTSIDVGLAPTRWDVTSDITFYQPHVDRIAAWTGAVVGGFEGAASGIYGAAVAVTSYSAFDVVGVVSVPTELEVSAGSTLSMEATVLIFGAASWNGLGLQSTFPAILSKAPAAQNRTYYVSAVPQDFYVGGSQRTFEVSG